MIGNHWGEYAQIRSKTESGIHILSHRHVPSLCDLDL